MKINTSVIIIHYNTPEHLLRCLTLLHSVRHNLEIIVVDNASKEKMSSLKRKFPEVAWIENTRNRGFSFAANQGAQQAKGRWLLFLNPDVFIKPAEIELLYKFAEAQHLDACSPIFKDDRYQKPLPTFQSLLQEFTPFHRFVTLPKLHQKTLVGGCLFIRKKVLENVLGWDERFFLWFEDSDLTQRLVSKGYKVEFAPLEIHHLGGGAVGMLTSEMQKHFFFHSMEIYIRKHFSFAHQQIIKKAIIDRLGNTHLYPAVNPGATWVVPNMDLSLLDNFLDINLPFFDKNELVIVSSRFNTKNIWQYRKKYPEVRFIPIDKNYGFSSTVNIGLRVATTRFLGTVNDDVILNALTLPRLMRHSVAEFGSLNPVIYSLDNTIESAGIRVFEKGKAEPIRVLPKQPKNPVQANNGACILFNHHALQKTGLFDEKFGSYLEDIDICLRLLRRGYFNFVIKDASLIHTRHQTSKKLGSYKQFLDMKNWWLVLIKNWSLSELLNYSPAILTERLRNISGFLKKTF